LEYQNVINLCYGWQKSLELQGHVPNTHTWGICKAFIMPPIVKQCNFKQNQGYLLISYALYVALTIFVNMQTCIHEFEASSHVK
jgi:hypothetical protein